MKKHLWAASIFVLFLIPPYFSFAIPPLCQPVSDSKPYLDAVLVDISFSTLKSFDIESYEAMDCSLGGLMADRLSVVYVTPKNFSSLGIQYEVQINLEISRDKKLITITNSSADKHPDSIRAIIESIEKHYRGNLVIAEFINRFGVKSASIHSDNDVALNGKDTAWLTFAYDTGIVYNTYPEISIINISEKVPFYRTYQTPIIVGSGTLLILLIWLISRNRGIFRLSQRLIRLGRKRKT